MRNTFDLYYNPRHEESTQNVREVQSRHIENEHFPPK